MLFEGPLSGVQRLPIPTWPSGHPATSSYGAIKRVNEDGQDARPNPPYLLTSLYGRTDLKKVLTEPKKYLFVGSNGAFGRIMR